MPLRMLRYLDLVLLALALPVFVAAGWPLFAWAGATLVWVVGRAAQELMRRRAAASDDPRTAVGLLSVSLIGRVWFIALAILAIGLIDRDSGLPAAVLTAVTFQVWLMAFMISRGMSEEGRAR